MLVHLPIDDYLPKIKSLLQNSNALVVTAEPGAGKTTRLPPSLLDMIPGKILVLEPRRVAAIAAAHRIASENNFELGQEVGYQVRFDNQMSDSTRLIFMTEALLTRQILRDPELKGVGAIILDEFHERSLNVDLALGWIKELQELGSKLKLIIMSATLQAQEISSYLGECPIVAVPGKLFPLEIQYQKYSLRPILDQDFYKQVSGIIQDAVLKTDKDALVFLPGVGEISRLQEFLSKWASQQNILLQSLHGSMGLEDQKDVLAKKNQQRIILSTNIAESSVTLDGVGVVVDTGLSKTMRFDHRTGFGRLELGRISQSSATQRAGRAARQYPGVCIRLWSKSDEQSMPKNEIPEIQRSDLSEAFLFLAANGITDFKQFSWFEKPNAIAIEKAVIELQSIGALDKQNRITSLGSRLIKYPLPPRLAKLMVLAEQKGQSDLGADLVALLQERDFVDATQSHHFLGDNLECDMTFRYHVLQDYKNGKKSLEVNRFRIQNVIRVADQYKKNKSVGNQKSQIDPDDIKRLILHSHLESLCKRREKTDRGLRVGGRGVKLEPTSLVRQSEFFIALNGRESEGKSETLVSVACGFDKDFLLRELGGLIQTQVDLYFDEKKNKFFSRKFKAFKKLALDEPSLEPANTELIQNHMADVLLERWDWVLLNNEALRLWWDRWSYFCTQTDQEPLSTQQLRSAFEMSAVGENNLNSVAAKDLVCFLEMQMDPQLLKTLHEQVPAKIKMPSGSLIPVNYPKDRAPYLEVRIQEVFGLKETPKVLDGKVSIVFHLLAPNYRPQQVTSDLQSFWKTGYPEVRKELRLRYPKHSWPEDPLTALPVAKGRSQKR